MWLREPHRRNGDSEAMLAISQRPAGANVLSDYISREFRWSQTIVWMPDGTRLPLATCYAFIEDVLAWGTLLWPVPTGRPARLWRTSIFCSRRRGAERASGHASTLTNDNILIVGGSGGVLRGQPTCPDWRRRTDTVDFCLSICGLQARFINASPGTPLVSLTAPQHDPKLDDY